MNVSPPTALFTGYAGMLLLVAWVLDRLAQHSRGRSDRCRPFDPDHTSAPRAHHGDQHAQPWPHSEADRFRRGLALLPVGLATLLLLILIVRHHQPGDLVLITVTLLLTGRLGYLLTQRFRRTPHGFPAPDTDRVEVHTCDAKVGSGPGRAVRSGPGRTTTLFGRFGGVTRL